LRGSRLTLGAKEIVAFTAVGNSNSRRVMEKIGMIRDPRGDYDHPRVEVGSPVRRHVLYRIRPGQLLHSHE
jgi:RimJ/RimL family protein N-acetyltransferase